MARRWRGPEQQEPHQLPDQPGQPIAAAEAGTLEGMGFGEDQRFAELE
jgi:hypothetical protein